MKENTWSLIFVEAGFVELSVEAGLLQTVEGMQKFVLITAYKHVS